VARPRAEPCKRVARPRAVAEQCRRAAAEQRRRVAAPAASVASAPAVAASRVHAPPRVDQPAPRPARTTARGRAARRRRRAATDKTTTAMAAATTVLRAAWARSRPARRRAARPARGRAAPIAAGTRCASRKRFAIALTTTATSSPTRRCSACIRLPPWTGRSAAGSAPLTVRRAARSVWSGTASSTRATNCASRVSTRPDSCSPVQSSSRWATRSLGTSRGTVRTGPSWATLPGALSCASTGSKPAPIECSRVRPWTPRSTTDSPT
jgi:hypothetical protein